MDGLYIVDKMYKIVRERRNTVVEAITEGNVHDYAAYRHLRGKLEAWNDIEAEIRLLLKESEMDDE